MSLEQNKELVRRFYSTIDTQGMQAADPYLASDFRAIASGAPAPLDAEAFKQFGAAFYSACPDLRHNLHDLIADGDRVVARLTATGSHRAELMGIAASGKALQIGAISAFRLEGGRIAELSIAIDMLGLLQQIGAAPTPAGV